MTDWQIIKYVIIGAVVVGLLIYYYYSHQADKKRSEALQKESQMLGLAFQAKSDRGVRDFSFTLPLFRRGRSQQVTNLMSGNYNYLPVIVGDFKYATGDGKNHSTFRQTFFLVQSSDIGLTRFQLQPENLWHKIKDRFGSHDIDFEMYPQFSKIYHLTGEDENAVRALMSSSILSYLENNPGLSIEADSANFLYFRQSKRVSPEQTGEFLRQGYELYKLFRR